jgi:hypothetical protein
MMSAKTAPCWRGSEKVFWGITRANPLPATLNIQELLRVGYACFKVIPLALRHLIFWQR